MDNSTSVSFGIARQYLKGVWVVYYPIMSSAIFRIAMNNYFLFLILILLILTPCPPLFLFHTFALFVVVLIRGKEESENDTEKYCNAKFSSFFTSS